MNMKHETKPTTVPETTQQVGEVLLRWSWTERAVWTERMLTALEQGVKGERWFRLFDKVFSERNLRAATGKVVANQGAPGVDHVTVEFFERDLEANLKKLSDQLRNGSYRPQAIRRKWIPKPGSNEQRPLGIPTVRDRVVQAALVHVIEPIFEREFAERSYGFRPGRGCKDALRHVDSLLREGYVYVVDADLKSYFDTIPHDQLMARLRERIADGRVLSLIEYFLQAGIMTDMGEIIPEEGAPQGAVLSPLLSNVYLNPLDHFVASNGLEMVRYADDFVILCRSEEDAKRALELVQQWTASAGLMLHPTKTRIVNVRTEGFDFLGYHFETVKDGSIRHWPRRKATQKLKETLRKKTKRTNGHSLSYIVRDVTITVRGWFAYFQHSYYTTFPPLDSWIRMRLRSILRKRCKRRGRGRGKDHQRWPNRFFTEHGLFNLEMAYQLVVRSSRR